MFSTCCQRYQVMKDHSETTKMQLWSNEPKKKPLAIFWSFICWIDLILHIVIVLNTFQLLAMLPGHGGSVKKTHKSTFLNDSKSQKRGFCTLSGVWSLGSTSHYLIVFCVSFWYHCLKYVVRGSLLVVVFSVFKFWLIATNQRGVQISLTHITCYS